MLPNVRGAIISCVPLWPRCSIFFFFLFYTRACKLNAAILQKVISLFVSPNAPTVCWWDLHVDSVTLFTQEQVYLALPKRWGVLVLSIIWQSSVRSSNFDFTATSVVRMLNMLYMNYGRSGIHLQHSRWTPKHCGRPVRLKAPFNFTTPPTALTRCL